MNSLKNKSKKIYQHHSCLVANNNNNINENRKLAIQQQLLQTFHYFAEIVRSTDNSKTLQTSNQTP